MRPWESVRRAPAAEREGSGKWEAGGKAIGAEVLGSGRDDLTTDTIESLGS
jgi:hypothetical protein